MGATGALASTQIKSHLLASPNDTVRVACVGVRGQGKAHLHQYSQMKNVEIAAICDIDEGILNDRLDMVEKSSGKKPAGYWEIRKLLEDKSIDAISIATPNHSHTMQTIWSLQAGKHVYCEKPCSHDVFESKQIVAANEQPFRSSHPRSDAKDERRLDRRRLSLARALLQMARYHRPRAG
jgi:hypothetical protein